MQAGTNKILVVELSFIYVALGILLSGECCKAQLCNAFYLRMYVYGLCMYSPEYSTI